MRATIRNSGLAVLGVLIALIAMTAAACGNRGPSAGAAGTAKGEPATAEEKRAEGVALLKQMSEKIASANAITFSTDEVIERVRRRSDNRVTLNINRELALRRPDRMWFKVTGDLDLEGFYDGKHATLVSHKEKVFGEIPTPATIDETVDTLSDKYDIPMPIGDLLTTNPEQSLVSDDTTGGLVGTENIDGTPCKVLSWQHPNVDWSIWIPASGDPLPKKLQITYKARRGQPKTIVTFKNWNLNPQLTDESFARRVPDDYEGIPVIQRASAVLPPPGAEKQDTAAATDSGEKKARQKD